MRIDRLASAHFRNLQHDPVQFSPGVNIFVGENGQGKTNILESLFYFKFGRSFRTSRDAELIHFGEDFCRHEVAAEYTAGEKTSFSAAIQRDGTKQIKVDGKDIGTMTALVGRYPIVLFGPQDLDLINGGPSERRRFIDMTGSMVDRRYLQELREYRRVLSQRNAALKAMAPRGERDVWDSELIQKGTALIRSRVRVVDTLDTHMKQHIDTLQIPYEIDIRYVSELLRDAGNDVTIEEQFTAQLVAVNHEETRRRTTLVGPHRDDIRIDTNRREARRYGSQGQRRLCAVLLRLGELTYLETALDEPCVLLLDDLFSELDPVASEKLMRVLDDRHQIFVTSPATLDWRPPSQPVEFIVSGGEITAAA